MLIALGRPASADETQGDLPSESCPALAASPLIYALVLNPLGSKTWAERHLEELRAGVRTGAREDLGQQSSFILLALHGRSSPAYVLEMTEAPREPGARPVADPPGYDEGVAESRLQSAFEAMGLEPEDLVKRPEVPAAVLTLGDAIFGLLDIGRDRDVDFRESVGTPVPRVERRVRDPRPSHIRYQKPLPQPEAQPLVFTKRAVRSVYKILLGVALGILIWGFVRNTA